MEVTLRSAVFEEATDVCFYRLEKRYPYSEAVIRYRERHQPGCRSANKPYTFPLNFVDLVTVNRKLAHFYLFF